MLAAGYAPSSGYTVVEWLAKISVDEAANTIEALGLLLRNPHTEHWTYTTHKDSIRAILEAALDCGIPEASVKAEATIGYLASIGESEYLNLTRPISETIH